MVRVAERLSICVGIAIRTARRGRRSISRQIAARSNDGVKWMRRTFGEKSVSIIKIYTSAHFVEMSKTSVVDLPLSDTEPAMRFLGQRLGGGGGSHNICRGTALREVRLRFFGESCNVGLRRVEARTDVTFVRNG